MRIKPFSDILICRKRLKCSQLKVGSCGTDTLDRVDIGHKFYEITDSGIILTDSVFKVFEGTEKENLKQELDARWSLLESAFAMKRENAQLINDIKKFYLLKGYERTDITYMKDMLNGYQEGRRFYCGEMLDEDCIHVDHAIPRAFLYHDEPSSGLVISYNSSKVTRFLPLREEPSKVKAISSVIFSLSAVNS